MTHNVKGTNMNTLYLDCASGISGDMTVAALLDLGADAEALQDMLDTLPLEGFSIKVSRVKKAGIDVCDFAVLLDHDHENHDHDMEYLHGHMHDSGDHHPDHHDHDGGHHPDHHDHDGGHHHDHHGRNLDEITGILTAAALSPNALEIALRIFRIVAEAESRVHGIPLREVHFHEVGAVDSIVDIASVAFCIDQLGIDDVIVTQLSEGSGTIRCQHGILPVPVPASSAILSAYQIPLHLLPIEGELVTPTGAAITAALRTKDRLPDHFVIEKTGMGGGKRNYAVPGILRAFLIRETVTDMPGETVPSGMYEQPAGESPAPETASSSGEAGTVLKIETNIDDSTGEALGFVMDLLFEAGALDVFYTPVYMKKNRPAVLLTILCPASLQKEMETILFRHTTSIGIRYQKMQRTVLARETKEIATPLGAAKVKICRYGEEWYCYPEHDSVAALSQKSGLGYPDVYNAVKTIATRVLSN